VHELFGQGDLAVHEGVAHLRGLGEVGEAHQLVRPAHDLQQEEPVHHAQRGELLTALQRDLPDGHHPRAPQRLAQQGIGAVGGGVARPDDVGLVEEARIDLRLRHAQLDLEVPGDRRPLELVAREHHGLLAQRVAVHEVGVSDLVLDRWLCGGAAFLRGYRRARTELPLRDRLVVDGAELLEADVLVANGGEEAHRQGHQTEDQASVPGALGHPSISPRGLGGTAWRRASPQHRPAVFSRGVSAHAGPQFGGAPSKSSGW